MEFCETKELLLMIKCSRKMETNKTGKVRIPQKVRAVRATVIVLEKKQ